MLKQLGRSRIVQDMIGVLAVAYLRLIQRTTRFVCEPTDFPTTIRDDMPVIAAMWHGQHFMIHYAWPKAAPVSALISRSDDGSLNANILERLGVEPIRGSGGEPAKWRKRGGVAALREMLRKLSAGTTVVLTADVPKVSRVAGMGIVTLAQMSGRPIHPIAVVTGRRIDFRTWDHASIGLPFGRGAMVLGPAIRVDRNADEAALEEARLAVERGLNEAHARAYALVGGVDPGQKHTLPEHAA